MSYKDLKGIEAITSDLIFAVLTVNNWTLEKCHAIYEGLKEQEFFDFTTLRKQETTVIFARLEKAGYIRADFHIGLLAGRVLSLANALEEEDLIELERLEVEGEVSEIEAKLLPIKGVGPIVVSNYLRLRQVEKNA